MPLLPAGIALWAVDWLQVLGVTATSFLIALIKACIYESQLIYSKTPLTKALWTLGQILIPLIPVNVLVWEVAWLEIIGVALLSFVITIIKTLLRSPGQQRKIEEENGLTVEEMGVERP